jgi:tetratricopeptide (TPR) repeat protein
VQNLLEEAKDLRDRGQLDEAIATLKRAIDLNRDDADAYLQLGLAYFDRQDYPEARKVLTVAAGLTPNNALIYYTFGRVCHAMGDKEGLQIMQMTLIIVDPAMSRKLADDTAQ